MKLFQSVERGILLREQLFPLFLILMLLLILWSYLCTQTDHVARSYRMRLIVPLVIASVVNRINRLTAAVIVVSTYLNTRVP